MSRKRVAPFRLLGNGIPTPNYQVYQYEYIRPGCYCFPQIIPEVTTYNYSYLDHWQPYCTAATYVVDRFGQANYPSDFECQLQVATSIHPQPGEITCSYYDDGEAEISALPQIDEDDIGEDRGVSFRKRKRFSDERDEPAFKKSYSGELPGSDIYRSKEGYLVEEPKENDN